jgi:UDP-N-acetylmuramate dehydrogenase
MGTQYSLFFIQRFKGKVLFNVPMSDYTSFRIGGPADVMAFPQDDGDLKELLNFAESKRFKYYVLGGGSNVLVRDGGIRGIVVNMADGFGEITWQDDTRAVVGVGVKLSTLLAECAERGLGGVEFVAGIPGTVGGAVIMNAGAYGFEMKGVVEGVEFVGRKGKRGFMPAGEMGFEYRKTDMPKGTVAVSVQMAFAKADPDEINEKVESYRRRRKATSSVGFPNAGSVFRNPEGRIAGRLIDEAGLKGIRCGEAEVSEVHANYIVNKGHATARDVLSLMAKIRDRVYKHKGILLEPEVKVVGEV